MQPRQDPTPKPGFYVLKTDGGITAEQGQAAGPAAIGVVLKDHKYRDVDEVSKRIGWARNHHEAEYKALIAGLELARVAAEACSRDRLPRVVQGIGDAGPR